MSFTPVVYGHGVRPKKAQKVVSKLTSAGELQPGEAVRLFVKCSNFKPWVDALLVTNARLLAASTPGDSKVKFAVGLAELGPLEPDEKGRKLKVSSPQGSLTFKAIPSIDIPVLVDHLTAGAHPAEGAQPSKSASLPSSRSGRPATVPISRDTNVPLRVFQPGYLSRTAPGTPAKDVTFAALDLETTGLLPDAHRVCEVAVVRFCGDGTVLDEYATLVDPQQRISPGAADAHNIAAEDVKGAPTFAEIWPDLLRMLSGNVVVAHNLLFEDSFIAAELSRLGQPIPSLAGVCSMVTCRAQLDGPSYGLQSVYRTATGQWIEDAHTALGDCRALTVLIPWLIAMSPSLLRYYGPQPVTLKPPSDGQTGRIFPRAERLTRHDDGYLGALAKRFPHTNVEYRVDRGAAQRYDDALDEITADQVITGNEGWRMEQLARHAGFNQQHLMTAHRAAWDRATRDLPVTEPDKLTQTQRRKLLQLAHDLGFPGLAAHIAVDEADDTPVRQYLRGWRIGVDGDDAAAAQLRTLIASNGGSVAKRLTATVRFVAATDTTARSPQLMQARELGLTVVSLKAGMAQITRALKAAEKEAKRREREQQQWQSARAKQQAEADAYYRHRWRLVEDNPEWGWAEEAVMVRLPGRESKFKG